MEYVNCLILGFKGFLIAFGFGFTAVITFLIFTLVCSIFGIGKQRKRVEKE